MMNNVLFDKFFIKDFLLSFCLIILILFSAYGLSVSFVSVGLMVYCIFSKDIFGSYFSLCIVGLLVIFNENIFDKPMLLGIARYCTMIVFIIKAAFIFANAQNKNRAKRQLGDFLLPFYIFGVIAMFTSIISGWYVHISILKIGQFLGFISALMVVTFLSSKHHKKMVSTLFALLAVIIFGSLMLHQFLPGFAYRLHEPTNKLLSTGLTYQSQALGVILGLGSFYIFYGYINSKDKLLNFLFLMMLAVSMGLIFITASRTALGILIVAITLNLVNIIFYSSSENLLIKKLLKRKLINLFWLFVPIVIMVTIFSNEIGQAFWSFIFKWDTGYYTILDVILSRTDVVYQSWDAFLKSPIFGEGFGVEKSSKFVQTAGFFSAPTEKSFLFTAVLHELGVVGAIAFLYLIFALFYNAKKYNLRIFTFFMVTFIVVNFGEYVFFSLGGVGIFAWLIASTLLIKFN